MTLTRLDVHDYDDTELGAEVRAAFALGCTIVVLYDGSEPDRRAITWADGTHGLYRMHCDSGDVWLSAFRTGMDGRRPVQDICPTCGEPGEPLDA